MEGFRLQTSDFRLQPSDGHVDDRTVVWKSVARSMKDGFTLVELMLVISIIGILAGVSIGVTRQVYHTARVAKTESTITKIDLVLLERYADFENRRVPSPNFGSNNDVQSQVTQAARLWFLRDMIRMEMPTNIAEATANPIQFKFKYGTTNDDITQLWVSADRSPLQRLYVDALSNCNGKYESAKCLYLVVTYGNPETRELFKDNEIATDDDGLSYFVDGWGNPIYFLRWAPGLVMSERQPNVLAPKQNADDWKNDDWEYSDWNNLTPEKERASLNHGDPLDPTEVGGVSSITFNSNSGFWEAVVDLTYTWKEDNSPRRGWALLPVVLSSGGVREDTDEKMFGIKLVPDDGDIPVVDPFHWPIGAPSPNYRNHAIIHNHSTRR